MRKDFIYNVFFKNEGNEFCKMMENILLKYIKKTVNVNEDFLEGLKRY